MDETRARCNESDDTDTDSTRLDPPTRLDRRDGLDRRARARRDATRRDAIPIDRVHTPDQSITWSL